MTTSLNDILLRRLSAVSVSTSPPVGSGYEDYVASFNKNLESLGYTLSARALTEIGSRTRGEIADLHDEVITSLKKMLGDNVRHRPMYPNFPTQVMDASDAELYINAIMHYLGDAIGVRIMPEYKKEERPALVPNKDLKIIDVITPNDVVELADSLYTSKVAYSETDREDVKFLILNNFGTYEAFSELKNKENLAFLAAVLHDGGFLVSDDGVHIALQSFSTATDTLRFAVALSGGDISLSEPTKFKKFKKADRRLFLTLLEVAGSIEEDMLRNASAWKRLGEIVHPGEYASRFPRAAAAFKAIRDNEKIVTFNSEVEAAIKEKRILDVVDQLKTRPGEFARRVDQLVTAAQDSSVETYILDAFNEVAGKVSPTVLLQMGAHFKGRTDGSRYRSFMPKGSVSKIKVIEEKRAHVSRRLSHGIAWAIDKGLIEQFSTREPLGKVFVDPVLKGYKIPFGNRSASKALHTLARGTRVPLPEGDAVRLFTHWKDLDGSDSYYGRVDIDLSAGFLGTDFEDKGTVAYYNLRNGQAYHSGDITSAPNGASEFIDINIAGVLASGNRYVYMTIHSYSRQKFDEIPELFAGFMVRLKVESGEVYDPRTVENKIDITAGGTQGIPLIIDLQEREMIWVDMNIPSHKATQNVHSNKSALSLVAEAMVTRELPDLYTLFTLHADSRGTQVTSREDADIVFGIDGDITPYDAEKILSEYL